MRIKLISALSLCALATLNACSVLDALDKNKDTYPFPLPKIEQPNTSPNSKVAIVWEKSIGDPISTEVGQSIINTVGVDIIVGSDNGTISRINSQNGDIVWKTNIKKITTGIAANDKYIAFTNKNNQLIILSAIDGKQIWSTNINIAVQAAPFITENIVVLRGSSNKLIAFNLDTQKLIWQYERVAQGLLLKNSRNSMISPQKGFILAGFHNAKMVLLDANTGLQKWEQTLSYSKGFTESERINDIVSNPVVLANTACSVSYQGKVGCFNLSNGELSWEMPFSSTKNLINDEYKIYATNNKSKISAFDYTGKEVWHKESFTNRNLTDGILINNTLIFNDFEGYIHLIDKNNGNIVEQIKLTKSNSVPIVKVGSMAIIHGDNGKIYGLKIQ